MEVGQGIGALAPKKKKQPLQWHGIILVSSVREMDFVIHPIFFYEGRVHILP
jgi:hypothetical protein